MNKQRLLELAGIGANMSNPSQEPYSEIPSAAENPVGAAGTSGFNEIGDSGEDQDPSSILARIREEAHKGVEHSEDAPSCCAIIISLIDGDQGNEDEARQDQE